MADQVTSLLQIVQQETGNNNNNWGNILNQQLAKLETAIAGQTIITVTGGTKALSDDEQRPAILLITGNLTSDSFIEVKPRLKSWIVLNATTGNYGVYLRTPSNPPYQVGQMQSEQVWCDGVTIWPVSDNGKVPVGGFVFSFRTVGASYAGDHSFRECDGSAVSRTLFKRLYDRVGVSYGVGDNVSTFNLPNLVDSGRYVRSRGGNAGQSIGAKQDDLVKSHTHTASTADAGWHYHPGSLTNSTGNHSHDYRRVSPTGAFASVYPGASVADYNYSDTPNTGTSGAHQHTVNLVGDGIHSHVVTVNVNDGVENRPTSIVAYPLIRVQ